MFGEKCVDDDHNSKILDHVKCVRMTGVGTGPYMAREVSKVIKFFMTRKWMFIDLESLLMKLFEGM
jgi:RIO-like serine/threonine protein kinase